MATKNVTIPKGMRDFGTCEMAKRKYIFDTIEQVFKLYGFAGIQTPSMEMMTTLMGKYGEEGDKLLFRVQNSGEKANEPPEKGLRYDLTVPFARYVVQHREELVFPFKRYQIQPVWRADRPQKGRYREFYQCDADIIGTRSLVAEAELILMVREVFRRLQIPVVLKLNNRKILSGIAEIIDAKDKLTDMTVAIDKLDKTSLEVVRAELEAKGIPSESIDKLSQILLFEGDMAAKLEMLEGYFATSETGRQGIAEMHTLLDLLPGFDDGAGFKIEFDMTLARGLNYYTGTILEVKAEGVTIGSISGGGRYDNLTAIFGLADMSGVGLSFGADRIYDVVEELDLFPRAILQTVQVLFVPMGEAEQRRSLQWAGALREVGIRVEVYPELQKMKKPMSYADRCGIPYVAIMGEEELARDCVMLKDMHSGEQTMMTMVELREKMK